DGACATQKAAVDELSAFKSLSKSKDAELAGQKISDEENNKNCEELKNSRKEAVRNSISTSQNEKLDGDTGTPTMQTCVKISGNNMRYLYGKNRQNINWDTILNASDECLEVKCLDKNASQTERQEKQKACNDLKRTAARCDAAAFLISEFGRDWDNPEHVKTETVKGGNPPITCQGKGVATLDYEGCVKFVQNGDLMDAAQTAIQAGQELYYKDKTMTAQAEAAQNPNSATATLEALKSGVKSQQDMLTQRAALDTGKLATLASYYSDMPSSDTLKDKCSSYRAPKIEIDGADDSNNGACLSVAVQPDFGFLMNQRSKDAMKTKLVKVGIDVGSNAVMASLMAKRANDISNSIANVNAFKPIDPLAPAADNLQTTYCQQNPGDAKCLTGGLDRTFDAMGDNVITFGDGGTGTSYNATNPFTDTTGTTTNAINPTSRNSVGSVGSVISAAQQNGGLETIAPKADVTKGAAPSAGGGGGGSGGGGASGGGGGVPGAQPQGGVSAAIQGKTPTYGGGSGTLSMMGGFGINKNKGAAKDDGNPFGKLFNKDGNKSGVVNFRDLASQKVGNKGDNLFEMISKRYSTVNSDKRLLEYELTK
ncbi:MAG: hypothetical protein ACXVLQ_14530, partial [Bacteriovorax sp.]